MSETNEPTPLSAWDVMLRDDAVFSHVAHGIGSAMAQEWAEQLNRLIMQGSDGNSLPNNDLHTPAQPAKCPLL
jgi:hypothetical protein